ncbi:glycosyltransferase [Richelia intracellularis]|nr:glycosyltransferase [Richelia intracellularis]
MDLLKRAVSSALQQTIPCEVVVVDEGSSDRTQSYMESLCAQYYERGEYGLVYHRHESNKGHAATVNTGVKKATGT